MSSKETKFSNELRDYLKKNGAISQKMHGNLFQEGVPDLLVGTPDGQIILIENKWTMSYSLTMKEIWKMLRVSQKSFFKRWKEYPIYVCVGSPRGVILLMADHFQKEVEDEKVEWMTMRDAVGPLVGDYD